MLYQRREPTAFSLVREKIKCRSKKDNVETNGKFIHGSIAHTRASWGIQKREGRVTLSMEHFYSTLERSQKEKSSGETDIKLQIAWGSREIQLKRSCVPSLCSKRPDTVPDLFKHPTTYFSRVFYTFASSICSYAQRHPR